MFVVFYTVLDFVVLFIYALGDKTRNIAHYSDEINK